MQNKKIFITTPWFSPAFKAGGPIQSIVNMVNEFNEGVEYYIFCGNTDLNSAPLVVEQGKWVTYSSKTMVWYASRKKRSETLVSLLEKIKPDIIFIIGIYSWHFNIVPLLFGKAPKKIISVRGMLHRGALSQKSSKKKLFLFLWKLFNWHKKASFHATDEMEKKEIEKVFRNGISISVAGNFPRRFRNTPVVKKNGYLKLVSIALISPMKNHLLVLQSFEKTGAIIAYDIYGPVKDMQYWQECIQQMKELPVNISVDYHGELMPDAVESKLQNGHIFILPSKSENFGHAIYEALSAGKPVITSCSTPWNGLKDAKAGINVSPTVIELAKAIQFFADMGQEEYDAWSKGAHMYAENSLDTALLRNQYKQLFSLPGKEAHNSNI